MEFRFGDITIKPSSIDRLAFPDVGLTKGDVISYYADIAELMIPELRGRPLTIERFNKGIGGPGFYQKHAQKYYPAWIERTEVAGKKTIVQPVINTAAGLVYMANQNAIPFHVPTATVASPANPDRLIFDLDPPPGRFDLVLEAARALRELLDELELRSQVKTTGSKGLHVVVPLDGSDRYREVYRFAESCAKVLCARKPDILTTEFYKKDRGGRLLLDIDRNHWQATAVAAYSVRARPAAPVSLPIRWQELAEPTLRPDGVGIRELPKRLADVGDLWATLHEGATSLARARELIDQAAGE